MAGWAAVHLRPGAAQRPENAADFLEMVMLVRMVCHPRFETAGEDDQQILLVGGGTCLGDLSRQVTAPCDHREQTWRASCGCVIAQRDGARSVPCQASRGVQKFRLGSARMNPTISSTGSMPSYFSATSAALSARVPSPKNRAR